MTVTRGTGFHHEAFLYGCPDEFLRATTAFVQQAVSDGAATLVILGTDKIRRLREALQSDADHVEFADMTAAGHNPARLIPAWQRFVSDHHAGGRPVRGIGEPVWPGRGPEELDECHRHEALLNLAFADVGDFTLLCPYDTAGLDGDVIEAAGTTHPWLHRSGRCDPSPRYRGTDPQDLYGEPLAPAPHHRQVLRFDSVKAVRSFVSRHAAAAGADPELVADVVLAVNELAANSVVHGGGAGTVSIWHERDSLVCEVRDRGHITDPLAGRRVPGTDQQNGRGLWVVNHVTDVVQIRTSPAGTVTRLHFRSARQPVPAR